LAVTILYVDDEPINLMLFEQWFNKKYNVHTAESGYRGLEVLQQQPGIKVIISDMRMPGMSGLEFIRKAKDTYAGIIFYILTGFEITREIEESLKNGLISGYFQKPFNMMEIDQAITDKLKI
jgi:two-component system response regulator (stage 0 sporulation protein F)